ncbi:hypothetical protein AALO_G00059470 [Alosa alosa]|uniref:Uncharacterized protein n=1 Tax=Alosa alosa TaxID=278164 RepID=A0AAV6H5Z8_9TELE|nr:hypothetical protein AALO_G00059470 [Alosa alosa]
MCQYEHFPPSLQVRCSSRVRGKKRLCVMCASMLKKSTEMGSVRKRNAPRTCRIKMNFTQDTGAEWCPTVCVPQVTGCIVTVMRPPGPRVPQSPASTLTDTRPQVVRVGNNISSSITLSTGAPQGCVLSPLLFDGAVVERVSSTKFLGVHISEDLSWTTNTASLAKLSPACTSSRNSGEQVLHQPS